MSRVFRFETIDDIKADDYIALIDLTTEKYAIKEEIHGLQEVEKHEKLLEWVKNIASCLQFLMTRISMNLRNYPKKMKQKNGGKN